MRRVYEYRRHLPHYQGDYKAIFITFSTHLRWILPDAARTIAVESCIWGNRSRYNLHAAVVMPDHVHLALTPLYEGDSCFSLVEIMQGIKSASAHKINCSLNRTGQIWQRESFDRVLRLEESMHAKIEYIVQNPVRAGLVKVASDYPWLWVPGIVDRQ
ncbi:MAG TPA: transposase [Terriglobales bacterium]|jgi:REP element-mobilizing transposase RayT|nr:transposase [Terriglobales bacterium]